MVRGTTAVATVSLLSDEPSLKKRRTCCDRRASSDSSGYDTTSSGERQAEDNDDEQTNVLSSSPVEQLESTTTDLPLVPDDDLDYLKNTERPLWIRMQYPPITSDEIRQAYMNDYADLYPEYMSLYSRLAQVAAMFTRLEVELHSTEPLAFASMEQRIKDECQRVKNDPKYKQDNENFHNLHAKLSQLKLMVYRYDIASRQVH